MNDKRVLFLSSGMLEPKKSHNYLATEHLYLNYGLLGLATIAKERGFDPILIHGNFDNPNSTIETIEHSNSLSERYPVLLSIPSSYSLGWARKICTLIKKINPKIKIIAGGRWVIADDVDWISKQLPMVDTFVQGVAENKIEQILGVSERKHSIPHLDYSILHEFKRFQPSLEVSRGCGMGCEFCAEANEKLNPIKPPSLLVNEVKSIQTIYNSKNINFYLEASFFRPSLSWIDGLNQNLEKESVDFSWRTETRADAMSPKHIKNLAKSGLKVLDIGLESASHQQLLSMNKTTKPSIYLDRASNLLKACHKNGVWAKVNILMYPGETEASFLETKTWLLKHKEYIKGVSAGPTILFRYGRHTRKSLLQFKELGASEVNEGDLDKVGYSNLHMSAEVSHDRALAFCKNISQNLMTRTDYIDLKTFSYLPRKPTTAT